jgi:MFS family permease
MLTRVGLGTPRGELMRRYWHPIAATVQLKDNPVRKVRILGDDLVFFRNRTGSALCGLAWDLPSLILFRLLQGIGGCGGAHRRFATHP